MADPAVSEMAALSEFDFVVGQKHMSISAETALTMCAAGDQRTAPAGTLGVQ